VAAEGETEFLGYLTESDFDSERLGRLRAVGVPEPGALALFWSSGLTLLALCRRRR
jgi:hypothetical protein